MLFWITVVAAFFAGLIKTGFGIGAGFILTPLLSLVMDTKEAIGMMTPMMLITDLLTIGIFWGKWDRRQVKIILPGCILGTVFGAYYLSWVSSSATETTIGIIAILFSSIQIYKEKKSLFFQRLKIRLRHGVFTSFFAGMASSIAHSGGIIMTIYLIAFGLTKERFIATLVNVLLFTDLTKLALFIKLDILRKGMIVTGLALTPVMLLGSWLGQKLVGRLNERQYTLYINILVFLSGLVLLTDPEEFLF